MGNSSSTSSAPPPPAQGLPGQNSGFVFRCGQYAFWCVDMDEEVAKYIRSTMQVSGNRSQKYTLTGGIMEFNFQRMDIYNKTVKFWTKEFTRYGLKYGANH
ncbi:hypothetical protein BGZ97_009302 [Linnemannia gamsii]|uniref:Uncharacterized protein n=1 Tax=Linnemannia gamsii TaxID=64522 RepID=A0A9P6QL96_9FUNG|nr:hypothetical protein BGZ97_009302 [Linnemannia gamsii]